jgi:hypothetical protein
MSKIFFINVWRKSVFDIYFRSWDTSGDSGLVMKMVLDRFSLNLVLLWQLFYLFWFIIVSAETEYISTISWYWNINFLRDRIRRFFYSPGPVACSSNKDDVSGNQNNCYWPLHSESIARCRHHMQEKLVYCCTYLENL